MRSPGVGYDRDGNTTTSTDQANVTTTYDERSSLVPGSPMCWCGGESRCAPWTCRSHERTGVGVPVDWNAVLAAHVGGVASLPRIG